MYVLYTVLCSTRYSTRYIQIVTQPGGYIFCIYNITVASASAIGRLSSLVEGIELTANSEEVGQSGVQLEQFWNIFKAVPPTK